MKNHRSPLLLLFFFFFFFTIINQEPIAALSPTPTPSPPLSPTSAAFPSPPPPPPPTTSPPPTPSTPTPPLPPSQQLNNIIDALIGSGDFTSWVSILSMANPMVIPLSATLFIPEDNTLDRHHPPIDPFLFPYHIVPQRLTFSDLLLFEADMRLPTLLPGKSISITSNSPDNFTIDDTLITHPDLYSTATVAVHGVAAVLDYSVFGDGIPLLSSPPTAPQELSPPFMPIGETIEWRPGAACSSTHVNFGFLIFCGVLASFSVMQRNPPVR